MAAPTTPGTGWLAGRIARGYAGFGLTPGMGLVVFGTSIERLAVGYGDLPALDGAEIRHIAWVLLEEHNGAPTSQMPTLTGRCWTLSGCTCTSMVSVADGAGEMVAEL